MQSSASKKGPLDILSESSSSSSSSSSSPRKTSFKKESKGKKRALRDCTLILSHKKGSETLVLSSKHFYNPHTEEWALHDNNALYHLLRDPINVGAAEVSFDSEKLTYTVNLDETPELTKVFGSNFQTIKMILDHVSACHNDYFNREEGDGECKEDLGLKNIANFRHYFLKSCQQNLVLPGNLKPYDLIDILGELGIIYSANIKISPETTLILFNQFKFKGGVGGKIRKNEDYFHQNLDAIAPKIIEKLIEKHITSKPLDAMGVISIPLDQKLCGFEKFLFEQMESNPAFVEKINELIFKDLNIAIKSVKLGTKGCFEIESPRDQFNENLNADDDD